MRPTLLTVLPRLVALLAPVLMASCSSQRTYPMPYPVEERTIASLQDDLTAGRVTSARLVEQYVSRIRDLDEDGPTLRSVLAVNPSAMDQAKALDRERAQGHVRGPLHGIPILVKDNIETADPVPTTAGSLALAANVSGHDAPVVARLRAAGAIILGKTNLSEWANFRSTASTSGWSAVGGLTRNAYALDRNACGSSSGSGVATAASFAAAAVGTETDGSITCPAATSGLVGLKPTVGLVSRGGIVPISSAQDTAGPMARTVEDAALLLAAMAGTDPSDPATREADARRGDYRGALSPDALRGTRLGLLRFAMGYSPAVDAATDAALTQLRALGAEVVPIEVMPNAMKALEKIDVDELTILLTDFRIELNTYLAATPPGVTTRTLADLIAFNTANAAREMPHFRQELFERAEMTAGHDPVAYGRLREATKRAAGPEGIDRLLAEYRVDALIAPTGVPAWVSDLAKGDSVASGQRGSPSTLPAVAGYPHVTVPMGQIEGLPVGLSFIGTAWSDARLLGMAYAFEQKTHARRPPVLRPAADR